MSVTENISVVLVEPKGDANMGAAARAMKNCGVNRLVLVKPARFDTPWGRSMACQAVDILMEARIEDSLTCALADVSCAVGFTARMGKHRKPLDNYEDSLDKIVERLSRGPIAFVFGREDDGLSNDELDMCEFVVSIPTAGEYSSLNLAQAVLIACHDVFVKAHAAENVIRESFVSRSEYEHILVGWKEKLAEMGYDDELKENILDRLHNILGRAGLSHSDVKMFEGLLSRL